jgi:hypothetical protein
MPQTNVVPAAEIYEFLRPKGGCIVSYNLSRTTKMRQNIIFKKFDNNRVSGLPAWYCLDPFGKIIGGSKNPPVLA